jgi:hypothetical protein
LKDKKSSIMLSRQIKLVPGKSYRFAYEVQCGAPALFTPSVRCGKTGFNGKNITSSQWKKGFIDFTVPAGSVQAQLRLWGGNLAPGKAFRLRNISLKELGK